MDSECRSVEQSDHRYSTLLRRSAECPVQRQSQAAKHSGHLEKSTAPFLHSHSPLPLVRISLLSLKLLFKLLLAHMENPKVTSSTYTG